MIKDKNIVNFKQAFVCSGPQRNVRKFYKTLIEKGVCAQVGNELTLQKCKNVALFCTIANKHSSKYDTYPVVTVVTGEWWKYWKTHRMEEIKKFINFPKKSYNVPAQLDKLIEECLILSDIELLTPDDK